MRTAALLLARRGLDALVVVAAVASAVVTLARPAAEQPDGARGWAEALAVALLVLLLLGRHRHPFGAPAAMWVGSAALSFVDGRLIVGPAVLFVTGMGAAILLGNLASRVQARIGLVIVVGAAAVVVFNGPERSTGDVVFTPVTFSLAWLVGFALRERADRTAAAEERAARAEREREAAARVAVAEERSRIARELHDVVAHALSVMVLQVGAVRHRMPAPDTEDSRALASVEQAGRAALTEMRRLLSAMRTDEEPELLPQPGLDDVATLVQDVRATGLDVRLAVHGDPVALPPGLDLSAYRILQEGLTNSLKHGGARRVDVEVAYSPAELCLEVRDDGSGSSTNRDGAGQGLVGVRERVKIYGGELTAGAVRAGGYVLRARIPLDGCDP